MNILRRLWSLIQLYRLDRQAPWLVQRVSREGLTYLDTTALVDLYRRVYSVTNATHRGIIIETGCAVGGSALVIAAAKQRQSPFYIYDTFDMIPPPTRQDGPDAHERYETIISGQAQGIHNAAYYGYQNELMQQVRRNFIRHGFNLEDDNIHLVQGLYEEMLIVTEPVAFAHIDCDWYDSVLTCLERIEPHLVPGGALVIDDYFTWDGCKKAVDTYFAGRKHEFSFVQQSRLHILRR